MRYSLVFIFNFLLFSTSLYSQKPNQWNSNEIYEQLQKLNFLGNVLYIAAHPDDENTRLISHLSNGVKANTAYLSLTRGDGGQNLVGTEIGPKLGLIRTHELLEARKIDGGSQFFTRAIDFGYSKHSDETLSIWSKDEVLKDMVHVIRKFRPDIIINRFDHRTPGETHGHHTSSAILSLEAFDLSADPLYQTNNSSTDEPWKVKQLFFNTGWWFYGSRENFEKADKSNLVTVDVGSYFPLTGISNSEIAAQSRTMHKSQGFGSTGSRGTEYEYLEFLKGMSTGNSTEIFADINTSWTRVNGGEIIEARLKNILDHFNFKSPDQHITELIELHTAIDQLDDEFWKNQKTKELNEIITQCLGLYLEAKTNNAFATLNSTIEINIELTNRSNFPISLKDIQINGERQDVSAFGEIKSNIPSQFKINYVIPNDLNYTTPYWLEKPESLGLYDVSDPELIGLPIGPASIQIQYDLVLNDKIISFTKDLIYKFNDPVNGESYEPFYILPEISLSFENPVYIFADRQDKELTVSLESFKNDVSGVLSLEVPQNWQISPKLINVNMHEIGEIQKYSFKVRGPLMSESGIIKAAFLSSEGNVLSQFVDKVSYNHIPKQRILYPAEAKLERIAIEKSGETIAYFEGAGDDVAKALEEIKYKVEKIGLKDLNAESLAKYDALIFGIRALNVHAEIALYKDQILSYISNGGTVIVQYNTNRGIKADLVSPYPLNLSRDRVTNESSPVVFSLPEHEILTKPNKITSRDFEGWVQERGLYFPDKWDSKFAAPLSLGDPGEPMSNGALLIASYGKGHFIYSGLSWFRQLPAGVPGAFRLFANMLSVGKNDTPNDTKSSAIQGSHE